MSLDLDQPFVQDVVQYVQNRQLYECTKFLEGILEKQPATPMHWLVGRDFQGAQTSYAEWLMACSERIPAPGCDIAIHTSMGEFEINYCNWSAEAYLYPNYTQTLNPYTWLCETYEDSRSLGDAYLLQGLEPLVSAFEYSLDYDDLDPDATSPIPPETFTAVCYLFFVRFLELNRNAHRLAAQRNNPLARCQIFCSYGDLVYHSPAKTT